MILKGLPSSPGKAVGKIRILEDVSKVPHVPAGPSAFIPLSWDEAVNTVKAGLEDDRLRALKVAGEESAAIFEAQMMMAEDPMLKELAEQIAGGAPLSEHALQAAERIAERFDAMEDEYLRARAADIRQIGALIADKLGGRGSKGRQSHENDTLTGGYILAARDLTPSQAVRLDTNMILGIALEGGTVNSHASILARAMGIPCIVGINGLMSNCHDGDLCSMDAVSGEIELGGAHQYERSARREADYSEAKHVRRLVTRDGHEIGLALNIGNPSEMHKAVDWNLAGLDIGLMRTEFIFMGADRKPEVEDQVKMYRDLAASAMGGRVRFRTLDIGGDKKPQFIDIPREDNPYLGLRSIRHSLRNEALFKDQLEALVKVAEEFPLDIMFPMVTVIEELMEARRMLDEVITAHGESATVRNSIRVGIMLETPAACLLSDAFAHACDFMSIGTNDLVQYTMAADRGNPDVSELYQQLNPAVLRLVKMCVEARHDGDCEISVCGELAGSPEGALLLAGLGVDKLSIAPASTGTVATVMAKMDMAEMQELAKIALKKTTEREVKALTAELLIRK